MHDAERLTGLVPQLVRRVQTIEHLARDRDRDLGGEAPLEPRERAEQRRERRAVHVLHREEVGAVIFAQLLHVHDVGVLDAGAQERLVDEHPDERGVGRQMRVHHLHRDVPREARGAAAAREEERRHPARLETGDDLVVADAAADVDGHAPASISVRKGGAPAAGVLRAKGETC